MALALGVAYRVAGRFEDAIGSLQEALRDARTIHHHGTAMMAVVHLALIWHPLVRLRRLIEKAEFAIEHAELLARVAPVDDRHRSCPNWAVPHEWNQVERERATCSSPACGTRACPVSRPLFSASASASLVRAGEKEIGRRQTTHLRAGGDVPTQPSRARCGLPCRSPGHPSGGCDPTGPLRWLIAGRRPDA